MRVLMLGRGGCGRTTLSVLLARELAKIGFKPLIIDADESNRGITKLLGVPEPAWLIEAMGGSEEVYKVVHGVLRRVIPLCGCLIKSSDGITLIQAGKLMVGGEGCACPIHLAALSLLRSLKDSFKEPVIIDTGSSVEFLGRGLSGGLIDLALFVADGAQENVELAVRIERMCAELGIPNFIVVVNKTYMEGSSITNRFQGLGFKVMGLVRFDPLIYWSSLQGGPLKAGPAAMDSRRLVNELLTTLSLKAGGK